MTIHPSDAAMAQEAITRGLVRPSDLHSTYRPLLPLCACGKPADGQVDGEQAYCARCAVERLKQSVKGLR